MSILDSIFGRKHPPMIGLDISSSSAKLVELAQSSSGEYILERFASESFQRDLGIERLTFTERRW